VAQPQMRTSTAPGGPSNAAGEPPARSVSGFGQLAGGWVSRLTSGRGSTPFRLRGALIGTIVFALVFAVLGAYGVGKRHSSIDATNHAAGQLLQLQDIRMSVVQADSLASRLYLTGGAEDPAARQKYLGFIGAASTELVDVALQLDLGADQAKALQQANAGLAAYAGLIEQARANNRQGFPVGAAYQRQANAAVGKLVGQLRVVEQSQRDAVDDELGAAHRAGAWLALAGWLLVAVLVLAGLWLAMRFRRWVNLPLGIGLVVVVVVLVLATLAQGRSVNDADDAVSSSLTTADLVAQARAAAFDAQSQEALTLINRGNGAANEAKWTDASAVVDAALGEACDRDSSSACGLQRTYGEYVSGHEQIRKYDEGGDWDTAVAVSLGRASATSDPDADVSVTVVPFGAFDTASTQVVQTSSAAARSALSEATNGLALMRVLVFLAGILVVVLASVGFGQRLREYR
jgi:uncharacterized membrane protein